jgi:hypothetical protein
MKKNFLSTPYSPSCLYSLIWANCNVYPFISFQSFLRFWLNDKFSLILFPPNRFPQFKTQHSKFKTVLGPPSPAFGPPFVFTVTDNGGILFQNFERVIR